MPAESAAIVLACDNTADSFVLPVQTQTELTIGFGALIMHVTVPEEREKEEKARGAFRTTTGLFHPCILSLENGQYLIYAEEID